MRHKFDSGNWFNDKKYGNHCNAVLNFVAESNDNNLKRERLTGLGSLSCSTVTKGKKIIIASCISATPQFSIIDNLFDESCGYF